VKRLLKRHWLKKPIQNASGQLEEISILHLSSGVDAGVPTKTLITTTERLYIFCGVAWNALDRTGF
jgi:hypothetical protein